jgi:hypothetical protein
LFPILFPRFRTSLCFKNIVYLTFLIQSEISNVFNNFFVNVVKDIGKDSTPINDCHPSICKIKDRCITNDCNSELFFKPVSDEFVIIFFRWSIAFKWTIVDGDIYCIYI